MNFVYEDKYSKYEVAGDVRISQAASYSFRFKPSGWAIWTVNDGTGEVSLQSDWGNYTYRWHVDHTGEKDMHHFLMKASADYIANKFSYGGSLKDEVDLEATLKSLQEIIRGKELPAEEQEDLLESARSWVESAECSMESAQYDEEYHELSESFNHDLHDYIEHRPCHSMVFLQKCLIPAFKHFLKEYLAPVPVTLVQQPD